MWCFHELSVERFYNRTLSGSFHHFLFLTFLVGGGPSGTALPISILDLDRGVALILLHPKNPGSTNQNNHDCWHPTMLICGVVQDILGLDTSSISFVDATLIPTTG